MPEPEPEPVGWRRLAAQTKPYLKDLVIKLGDLGFKKAEVQEVWRFEPAETVQCDVIIGRAGPPESGEISPWVCGSGRLCVDRDCVGRDCHRFQS